MRPFLWSWFHYLLSLRPMLFYVFAALNLSCVVPRPVEEVYTTVLLFVEDADTSWGCRCLLRALQNATHLYPGCFTFSLGAVSLPACCAWGFKSLLLWLAYIPRILPDLKVVWGFWNCGAHSLTCWLGGMKSSFNYWHKDLKQIWTEPLTEHNTQGLFLLWWCTIFTGNVGTRYVLNGFF